MNVIVNRTAISPPSRLYQTGRVIPTLSAISTMIAVSLFDVARPCLLRDVSRNVSARCGLRRQLFAAERAYRTILPQIRRHAARFLPKANTRAGADWAAQRIELFIYTRWTIFYTTIQIALPQIISQTVWYHRQENSLVQLWFWTIGCVTINR